jgi:hypothetical protein
MRLSLSQTMLKPSRKNSAKSKAWKITFFARNMLEDLHRSEVSPRNVPALRRIQTGGYIELEYSPIGLEMVSAAFGKVKSVKNQCISLETSSALSIIQKWPQELFRQRKGIGEGAI